MAFRNEQDRSSVLRFCETKGAAYNGLEEDIKAALAHRGNQSVV